MKVKDLIKQLLDLNLEAEVNPTLIINGQSLDSHFPGFDILPVPTINTIKPTVLKCLSKVLQKPMCDTPSWKDLNLLGLTPDKKDQLISMLELEYDIDFHNTHWKYVEDICVSVLDEIG